VGVVGARGLRKRFAGFGVSDRSLAVFAWRGDDSVMTRLGFSERKYLQIPLVSPLHGYVAYRSAEANAEALLTKEGVNLKTPRGGVRATLVRPCVAESANERNKETARLQRVLDAL
jgi:hypothetical protein